MDADATLTELRTQHALIMECIAVFERLAAQQPRRRGRPPKWLADANQVLPAGRRSRSHKKRSNGKPAGAKGE
jgi:hypothetical protein